MILCRGTRLPSIELKMIYGRLQFILTLKYQQIAERELQHMKHTANTFCTVCVWGFI